ncbi:MAG: SDR family oxidoreductase [Acidobacteria bacterium]|nr:SDR family oxidoreductase [Acidobacteriota bacterium]
MSNKVAVVTGGTAGLGRAIVRELAGRGYDVAILARGKDGLDGAVADVEAAGVRGLGISTDVADRNQVEGAADEIEFELGEIDLWVNNAMVGVFGEFAKTNADDFERAVSVDFIGFVNGTRAALTRMAPRDRGHIVQVGSALAHRGIPLQAAYCASKHAITGFTESVLGELMHDRSGVRISQVDMPAMNTMQFDWVKSALPAHPQPVPPIYQPEVCARIVADVAQRPRRRTWVGESTVMTILGNRFASRISDLVSARTGFSGQQDTSDKSPMLGPNLYEPVPGDHGAHGDFDGRAWSITPQTWAIQHRRGAVAALSGLVAAVLLIGTTARARS